MRSLSYQFPGGKTEYYLGESLDSLGKYADPSRSVIILDREVAGLYGSRLEGWSRIVLPSGEDHKSLDSLQKIIDGLIDKEADRQTLLIGMGGGVITDLAGFAASIYLRGVPYAAIPTSLLGQVDAAIGGKNGINYHQYKNILGTIRQPDFILFDFDLLATLPASEWTNGYAEIIKYGCIMDEALFDLLESQFPFGAVPSCAWAAGLVERSLIHKSDIVVEDERESGRRRLLNFGHTFGHALEKLQGIPHGQAVSLGMVIAAGLSEQLTGLEKASTRRLVRLLEGYGLPVKIGFDQQAVLHYMRMDKKRVKDTIHLVLLERIGKALTKQVNLDSLERLLAAK